MAREDGGVIASSFYVILHTVYSILDVMDKLLIATRNIGKFKEIKVILGEVPYEIVCLEDLSVQGDVVEDGETYEENALKKARFFSMGGGGVLTLSDDSGLEVSALKGELGLKTRRWGLGESASDEEWLEYFLKEMEGTSDRSARFVCCAALCGKDGFEKVFFGETRGVITHKPEAPLLPGLPLSSCFRPEGQEKVYAALSEGEKGEVSHRGWAISAVRRWLMNI